MKLSNLSVILGFWSAIAIGFNSKEPKIVATQENNSRVIFHASNRTCNDELSSDIDVASMKSLFIIARFWKKSFDRVSLCRIAGVTSEGVSLSGLQKAAISLGFQARTVRFHLSYGEEVIESSKKYIPWIAHWQEYFVVVHKITRKRVLIEGPNEKEWVSHQEFLDGWNGIALLVTP